MYDADGETLLMVHALRRIQYTTCQLEDRQFAFVSRNPQGNQNLLFCHLFVGSEASEVQVLNLLLCRCLQLQYLLTHPEAGDPIAAAFIHEEAPKNVLSGAVVREALSPEEVSQNMNALVSFRRLLVTAQVKNGSNQTNVQRSSSLQSPYCSPILVRKKVIRSKVLHSVAYRGPKCKPHDHESGAEGRAGYVVTELSEKLEVLLDAVWFCTGVHRDKSIALLRDDQLRAFLLLPDMEHTRQLTLNMNTRCGVIPYAVHTTSQGKFYFEHLPQEFARLADLVGHCSNMESSLFFQLAQGRVNPCYKAQDVKNGQRSPPTQHRSTLEPQPEEPAKTGGQPDTAPELTIYHI
ncbi:LOW QUALITY PROTEIN: SH2 domain-containing protein 5 [Ranitomeya variabilis]|uniref:LOW QUALITY PROTEIN: SH2 domain-containing protein 5 n=1 Tax=Ranitomeya variabilis TaxID=490064 RepID=UPI0040572FA6